MKSEALSVVLVGCLVSAFHMKLIRREVKIHPLRYGQFKENFYYSVPNFMRKYEEINKIRQSVNYTHGGESA